MVSPIRVAVGVIRRGDLVLIAKRPDHLHKGGLWEFPGGKIDPDESLDEALVRELKEELDIDVMVGSSKPLTTIDWHYSEKTVRLEVCLVENFSGEPKGKEGQLIKWEAISHLGEYSFPEANAEILNLLIKQAV